MKCWRYALKVLVYIQNMRKMSLAILFRNIQPAIYIDTQMVFSNDAYGFTKKESN